MLKISWGTRPPASLPSRALLQYFQLVLLACTVALKHWLHLYMHRSRPYKRLYMFITNVSKLSWGCATWNAYNSTTQLTYRFYNKILFTRLLVLVRCVNRQSSNTSKQLKRQCGKIKMFLCSLCIWPQGLSANWKMLKID